MINILYDYQIFLLQNFGGISKYHTDIIEKLSEDNSLNCTLPIKYTNNEYILNLAQFAEAKQFKIRKFHGRNRLAKYVTKKINPFRVARKKNSELTVQTLESKHFDIIHPTYYDNYILSHIGQSKLIITIHDMIHELFPEHVGILDKTFLLKKELIKRADRIITVSHNTKKDLLNLYRIDPNKIDVIHLGINMQKMHIKNNLAQSRNNYPYILFVGNRNAYKNFYTFVYAIEPILKSDPELKLLCTGPEFSTQEYNFFHNLGLSNKIIHNYFTGLNIKALYSNAELFAFPSQYEGFGLPILEAFASNCPCALSESSSFPEVAGDAALYFNPKDHESIYTQINTLLYDTNLRLRLVEKGSSKLKGYTVDTMTEKTKATYYKALNT